MKRSIPFLAVLVLVLAGGCGKDEPAFTGAEPETWLADVCGALDHWSTDVQAIGAAPLEQTTTVAEARTALVKRFDAMVARGGEAHEELVAAGTPAVEDGALIREDVLRIVDRQTDVLAKAGAKIGQLPVKDQATFSAAASAEIQTLQGTMSTEMEQVGAAIDAHAGRTLEQAADDVPACETFIASSG